MNNTPIQQPVSKFDTPPCVRKTIDKTTYLVRIHFSETAKETLQDKILRLLLEEVRKM